MLNRNLSIYVGYRKPVFHIVCISLAIYCFTNNQIFIFGYLYFACMSVLTVYLEEWVLIGSVSSL